VILAGGGHFLQEDLADELVDILNEFVATTPSGLTTT
jgi:hypothetical protein